MLDQDTKRRIDTARDILVGKLPNPQAQVEQITIAMIYKFMDDMDKEAMEFGGEATFFTGEFEKYSWTKIFDPKLGGFEMLALYGEAIVKLNQNPSIPQLFRDIFKNAFLPYRDPETLKMFLKIINEFHYDHSEKLGDAFEYLLSVLGSQGDAGQFRTPRHIIDFMVAIMQPKKEESICDPACGTAGFLISSYKHILSENTKKNKGDLLTPDDRKKLINNFVGYDISAEMVRLSLVNLYLHGFTTPKIYEYDTLTSEDRWGDYFDIILANPPFMTPKGGIRPHKKFAMQANRSEVLFVDYIMEHINPTTGRAAIIVPEGIIFQSATAYKALRKLLVDKNFLYGVISLPAGIFQPYSGVKTSILLLDKSLAKKTDKILFAKIENDGFALGSQRRELTTSDLPDAISFLKQYIIGLRNNDYTGIDFENLPLNSIVVEKSIIGKGEEYNLSSDRYNRIELKKHVNHELFMLQELVEMQTGSRDKGGALSEGIPSIGGEQINSDGNIRFEKMKYISQSHFDNLNKGILKKNDVLLVKDGATTGKLGFYNGDFNNAAINEHVYLLRANEKINSKLLYYILRSDGFQNQLKKYIKGIIGGISSEIGQIQLPVPNNSNQQILLSKIEKCEKIIGGAKQVVENYKPQIDINPEWELVELDNISEIVRGSSPRPAGDPRYYGGVVPRLMVADVTRDGMYVTPKIDFLTEDGASLSRPMKKGDLVMAVSGQPGLCSILATDACIHDGFAGFRNLDLSKVITEFAYYSLMSLKESHNSQSVGAIFQNLNTDQLRKFKISIPSLKEQGQIVEQLSKEQDLINANRTLIDIYEKKINDEINKLWAE
jgi:type I restriction enzyme M protein